MKVYRMIANILLCFVLIGTMTGFNAYAETPEWKSVYIDYFDKKLAEDPKNYISMSRYLLYDIDGNDIPELIVSSGRNDTETKTLFYTCNGEQIDLLCEIPTGYVVYEADDTNDRLIMLRNLDEKSIYTHIVMENNQIFTEELKTNDTQETCTTYRQLKMVGPGNLLPILQYEEIQDYLLGIFPHSESVCFPNQNEAYFEELIADNIPIQVIQDSFGYFPPLQCKFHVIQGNKSEIINTIYADLNGDGQLECIIDLGGKGTVPLRLFISVQDNKAYAYVNEFAYGDITVLQNGNLLTLTDGYKELSRLIFDKENWLLMPLPLELAG